MKWIYLLIPFFLAGCESSGPAREEHKKKNEAVAKSVELNSGADFSWIKQKLPPKNQLCLPGHTSKAFPLLVSLIPSPVGKRFSFQEKQKLQKEHQELLEKKLRELYFQLSQKRAETIVIHERKKKEWLLPITELNHLAFIRSVQNSFIPRPFRLQKKLGLVFLSFLEASPEVFIASPLIYQKNSSYQKRPSTLELSRKRLKKITLNKKEQEVLSLEETHIPALVQIKEEFLINIPPQHQKELGFKLPKESSYPFGWMKKKFIDQQARFSKRKLIQQNEELWEQYLRLFSRQQLLEESESLKKVLTHLDLSVFCKYSYPNTSRLKPRSKGIRKISQ